MTVRKRGAINTEQRKHKYIMPNKTRNANRKKQLKNRRHKKKSKQDKWVGSQNYTNTNARKYNLVASTEIPSTFIYFSVYHKLKELNYSTFTSGGMVGLGNIILEPPFNDY